MRVRQLLFLFSLVVLTCASAPASADTDYNCLHTCVAGGKSGAACLPQCIVNPAPGTKSGLESHTDYRCLQTCVNNGQQSGVCLAQCTYQEPIKDNGTPQFGGGTPQDAADHRVLDTVRPLGSEALLPTKPTSGAPTTSISNYTCINQCVQSGMQYQTCEQRCNTTPTK